MLNERNFDHFDRKVIINFSCRLDGSFDGWDVLHGSDDDLSQNAVIPETDDEMFPPDTDNLEYGLGSDPSIVSTVYFSCIKLRYCIACPAIIFYSLCLFFRKNLLLLYICHQLVL